MSRPAVLRCCASGHRDDIDLCRASTLDARLASALLYAEMASGPSGHTFNLGNDGGSKVGRRERMEKAAAKLRTFLENLRYVEQEILQ